MSKLYPRFLLVPQYISMRITLFLLVWISILLSCSSSTEDFPPTVRTIYQPAISVFQEADRLRYKQDYARAMVAYELLLQEGQLMGLDSLYALNQLIYSQLIWNSKEGVEKLLEQADGFLQKEDTIPAVLLADHRFNQGRFHFLQNQKDSALRFTHQALKMSFRTYPKGHLKQAQTLNLLALIHRSDGNLTDSIHHYALQANAMFVDNPELSAYDWENDYIQGYASLLYRAHERGVYYCRSALNKLKELQFENYWLEAKLWNLLGNLYKKQSDELVRGDPSMTVIEKEKLYHTADSFFQKAIEIGRPNQDEDLMIFYIEWVINNTRFSDSTYFFQAMQAFEQQFSGHPDGGVHFDRLLGYYYYGKDVSKTIQNYRSYLKRKDGNSGEDYRILADAYHSLRVAYRAVEDFDSSAIYARKSLLLYDCLGDSFDILRVEDIDQIDSTKRYCLTIGGFFAEGLLLKYQKGKKPEDLALANAYYDFVEKHGFKSLLNKDEDAFLTFQLEAGSRIYSKALEAASETWRLSSEPKWLDKAMSYMEYLKSYLLYRDMLKGESEETGYSLSDSIRLLQGQVNQLLFTAKTQDLLKEGSVNQNNLINKLSQLEHKRATGLSDFQSRGYQNRISLREVRKELLERQGVVNYYNSASQLFGLYIDRDTSVFFQVEDGHDELKAAVQDYRASIEEEVKLDEETISKYLKAGRTLYQILISPFADRLENIDQLVIIPDQLLDPVPFEAFLSRDLDADAINFKDLPYLLYQVQIVYTSAWKVYQANREKVAPNFENTTLGFWTTPELSTINGLDLIESSIQANFGNNYQVFSQSRGGKALFQELHPQFDVIHLLLHANSNRGDRYDNRIRFGNSAEDQIYGFELYKEKFKSKLAVLASCESAAGAAQRGEGTFSLARSFINSGIPEIVAAQFLIPQTTTGPLLSYFYQHLGAGVSTPAALHLAKIDFLQKVTKERHAYPRFWAGMVVFN